MEFKVPSARASQGTVNRMIQSLGDMSIGKTISFYLLIVAGSKKLTPTRLLNQPPVREGSATSSIKSLSPALQSKPSSRPSTPKTTKTPRRPEWNDRFGYHNTPDIAKPGSVKSKKSMSSLTGSPLTPHPRMISDVEVNQLRGRKLTEQK